MEKTGKRRRIPMCKQCCTPMKGHLKNGHDKGRCRPNPWVDHGDNHKEHGGKYKWETQRWNGKEWKPVPASSPTTVIAIAKDTVTVQTIDHPSQNKIVPLLQISQAPPPGTCPERDAWLSYLDKCDSDSSIEAEPKQELVADKWKPLVTESMWYYYKNWQRHSTTVSFPTNVGMTSSQLGDIMQHYKKYEDYFR